MHFVLMGIALEKAMTSMLVESLRVWSETVRVSERERRASERLAAAAAAERMLQAAAHCLAISQERPSSTFLLSTLLSLNFPTMSAPANNANGDANNNAGEGAAGGARGQAGDVDASADDGKADNFILQMQRLPAQVERVEKMLAQSSAQAEGAAAEARLRRMKNNHMRLALGWAVKALEMGSASDRSAATAKCVHGGGGDGQRGVEVGVQEIVAEQGRAGRSVPTAQDSC